MDKMTKKAFANLLEKIAAHERMMEEVFAHNSEASAEARGMAKAYELVVLMLEDDKFAEHMESRYGA